MSSSLGPQEAHGNRAAAASWALPRCVVHSTLPARPDQGNKTESSEFVDQPEVLQAKIKVLADLIRRSRCTVAYTGAGLSRAAGIPDYGSKAAGSVVGGLPKLRNVADAQPTYAHYVLTALERAGLLHEYVQQNHDGLPQKSGFPQEKMNEIHGAWFDPSNPVVKFSGSLRGDLFEKLLQTEERADLCLCLGTSLSGMNADRTAKTPARKNCAKGDKAALGTVIINLQRTHLDSQCSVRIWAKLDDALRMLATELGLSVHNKPMQLSPALRIRSNDCFQNLPYTKDGALDPTKRTRQQLDLSEGSTVRISVPESCFANQEGLVIGKDQEGNYILRFRVRERRKLGRWWIAAAVGGKVDRLPVMNVNPVIRVVSEEEAARLEQQKEEQEEESALTTAAAAAVAASVSSSKPKASIVASGSAAISLKRGTSASTVTPSKREKKPKTTKK